MVPSKELSLFYTTQGINQQNDLEMCFWTNKSTPMDVLHFATTINECGEVWIGYVINIQENYRWFIVLYSQL